MTLISHLSDHCWILPFLRVVCVSITDVTLSERLVEPDLSVIIVNWNTREILLNCLASIEHGAGRFEVIVVDNAL